ncbi:MAG: hypothetical protein ACXU9D_12930, partial [Xanthobacteraceae bacterium]
MAPLHSIPRVVRSASLVAACMLAHAAAAAPAGIAGPPTCRELERRLELTKPEAHSTELNLVLFSAADSGPTAGVSIEHEGGIQMFVEFETASGPMLLGVRHI